MSELFVDANESDSEEKPLTLLETAADFECALRFLGEFWRECSMKITRLNSTGFSNFHPTEWKCH